jgi:hypothetical protein
MALWLKIWILMMSWTNFAVSSCAEVFGWYKLPQRYHILKRQKMRKITSVIGA